MKKKSIPKDKQALQPNDNLFLDDVVSTTECTGLIPTPPQNEAEAESYTDLYAVPKPENKEK